MTRSQHRVVAGVCAGLAEHLGLKPSLVRAGMAASVLVLGAGLLFYAWLWLLVPVEGEPRGPQQPPFFAFRAGLAPGARDFLLGAALLAGAGVLVAQQVGVALSPGTLIPLAVIAAGAVLAWMQLDDTRRAGLVSAAGASKPAGMARLVGGLILVIVGVLVIVAGGGSWAVLWPAILASLAVLAGVALVLAPWALKFWRDLQQERAGRIRERERAEIAAHLHDSVLQTLALIQRRAESPQDVSRLARAQERELRDWIYRDASRSEENLVSRIKAEAAELEDAYASTIDVVAVGDAPLDDGARAVVQAAREAMLNAVRHAGTPVSVYIEASGRAVEVFVKDRGPGFDSSTMGEDRLGVRESILGRMKRHGGTAVITSGPDGTEVALKLSHGNPPPASADSQRGHPHD